MPRITFTSHLQKYHAAPTCNAPGATVREALDRVFEDRPAGLRGRGRFVDLRLGPPAADPLRAVRRVGAFAANSDGRFDWALYDRPQPRSPRIPRPDVIALRVASQDDKEMWLAVDEGKFFSEPHYNGYPVVLVRLAAIDVDDLAELITDAWRCLAPHSLVHGFDDQKGVHPSCAILMKGFSNPAVWAIHDDYDKDTFHSRTGRRSTAGLALTVSRARSCRNEVRPLRP